jgi:hypothetical protein
MKIIKNLIKRLKAHTPDKWRKFGNKLVGITTVATIPADLIFSKEIALAVFLIGIIGRCLVEFTTDEPT